MLFPTRPEVPITRKTSGESTRAMGEVTLDPGKIGIWTHQLDGVPSARAREAANEIEEMGFGAIWIPETAGRDPFVHSSLLLSATQKIVLATGIASIYSRDALAMASATRTLSEAFADRFLLGVGVSHGPFVEVIRGHTWEKPLENLSNYIENLKKAPFWAYRPENEAPICIGALGPKALKLAAELTWGAHPYNVTADHTLMARETMGKEAFLAPMVAVILETDSSKARELARKDLGIYLDLPNYRNNLLRIGFTEDDLSGGGSDRVLDAIRPWGDIETISNKITEHFDAGADHICVQLVVDQTEQHKFQNGLPIQQWQLLAESLL